MSLIEWPVKGKINQIFGCDICSSVEAITKDEGEYEGISFQLEKSKERKVICSKCLGQILREGNLSKNE